MALRLFILGFAALLSLSLAAPFEEEIAAEFIVPSPDGTEPKVCSNPDGKAFQTGKCGCKFIFNKDIKVKQARKVKSLCKFLFGPTAGIVRNLVVDCDKFISKSGAVRTSKLIKSGQRFLDLCTPDSMIMLMLKGMETATTT